jgi:hypothetical protein
MPLTCYCEENYDAEWWWWSPDDYSVMPFSGRRKRCRSCRQIITAGELVAEFERTRGPRHDIELNIYGDGPEAVKLASWYLCEPCADLFFSLDALGFCISPDENQHDLVREHAAMAKPEIK